MQIVKAKIEGVWKSVVVMKWNPADIVVALEDGSLKVVSIENVRVPLDEAVKQEMIREQDDLSRSETIKELIK